MPVSRSISRASRFSSIKFAPLFAATSLIVLPAFAAPISTLKLVSEAELNGAETVDLIDNPTTNSAGGFSARLITNGTSTSGFAYVYGNAARGSGSYLRKEQTVGTFTQTNFDAQQGISNSGVVGYSAAGTDSALGTLDTIYTDGTQVAATQSPIGGSSSFSSKFYGTNLAGMRLSSSGTPVYVATVRDSALASDTNRALVSGANTMLLKSGDSLANAGAGVQASGSTVVNESFSIGNPGLSRNGSNYVSVVDVKVGSTATDDRMVVINGAVPAFAGSSTPVREGETVPASAGGVAGEVLFSDSFGQPEVNDSGNWIVSHQSKIGAQTGSNFIVMHNGQLIARQGDSYAGVTLGSSGTPAVSINNNDDFAFIYGETLFFNNKVVLTQGDLIDTNGDGVSDTPVNLLQESLSFSMSERYNGDLVDFYIMARVNVANPGGIGTTDDILLRVTGQVPEPASLTALGSLGLLLARRRR